MTMINDDPSAYKPISDIGGNDDNVSGMFKNTIALNDRIASADRIRRKHPGHVPVVVERSKSSSQRNLPTRLQLRRRKFIVPSDYTIAHLLFMIRRTLSSIGRHEAIFVFIADTSVLPSSATTVGAIDQEHRDEDGMLYLTYGKEHAFG